jgi:hypothetical protein
MFLVGQAPFAYITAIIFFGRTHVNHEYAMKAIINMNEKPFLKRSFSTPNVPPQP